MNGNTESQKAEGSVYLVEVDNEADWQETGAGGEQEEQGEVVDDCSFQPTRSLRGFWSQGTLHRPPPPWRRLRRMLALSLIHNSIISSI